MTEQSEFMTWFTAQCGKRENTPDSDDELYDRAEAGRLADTELHRRLDWDMRRTAALWAWQAARKAGKP